MIATGHPLATAAGLEMLREGGTAADAAVTAAAVCCVTLPHRTAIGGDAFAVVYDSQVRSTHAYNGSGAAPAAIRADWFTAGFPPRGALLATVPGLPALWEDLCARHGRFGLKNALAPAIRLAEHGFPVSPGLVRAFSRWGERLAADTTGAAVLHPRRDWRPGDVLRQPDLAASLRAIAEGGAAEFYSGELGGRLVQGIAIGGGVMSREDLALHRTEHAATLELAYRGWTIHVPPPVSLGFVLLEELAIIEGFDVRAHEWADPDLVHLMVEAKKLAFEDRDRDAGDPRSVDFDARALLHPTHVATRRAQIGDRARAPTITFGGATDTTYLSVVDGGGNAVSFIESIFHAFGAATMVPGTGILLNNRVAGFATDPRSPNVVAPGKRPMHTLNPVLVTENGRLRAIFGTPARDAQVQTNFQMAVSLLDFNHDVQGAIEHPRWRHDVGRVLQVESRFDNATCRALAARGHEIQRIEAWAEPTGGVQAIRVEPDGSLAGGADPRREGTAAGY